MEYMLPDKAIKTIEDEVIFPSIERFPTLAAIIKYNAPEDDISFLKSIKQGASKYQVPLKVFDVKDDMEAGSVILDLRNRFHIDGIILLSDFGLTQRGLGNMIPTLLDIDCANSTTMGMLLDTDSIVGYRLAPSVAIACYKYLEAEDIDFAGKNIAIIGRSLKVGRPLAEILLQKDATTTLMHSKSRNIDLSPYDIVISTIGHADVIDNSWWKHGFHTQYMIDVGYNVGDSGNVRGDINIESLQDYDFKINPIVGGLGRLTTTVLFGKLYANSLGRIPDAMIKRGVK